MSKKNQSGRSMVEILGVLAIIGVLSVGGIAGYKLAMDYLEFSRFVNDTKTILFQFKGMKIDPTTFPRYQTWKDLTDLNKIEPSSKWLKNDSFSIHLYRDDGDYNRWGVCPGCVCLFGDISKEDYPNIVAETENLRKKINTSIRFGSDVQMWMYPAENGDIHFEACTPVTDGYVIKAFSNTHEYNDWADRTSL